MNAAARPLSKGPSFFGAPMKQAKPERANRQGLLYKPLRVSARKGRGGGGYRAIETLSTTLASQIEKNTELNTSLLKAERTIAKLEKEGIKSDQKVRILTNAVLDRSGKKDIRSALEVIAEVTLRMEKGKDYLKGVRSARALITSLLADKDDTLGLQTRVNEVAKQVSLRPQDLLDNLKDLYNRFASTFHGLDGPVVVVNVALSPEVNVRAALCLFLDWGKVNYVYVEDGCVTDSPYRLPSDPFIEEELGMSLSAIQD